MSLLRHTPSYINHLSTEHSQSREQLCPGISTEVVIADTRLQHQSCLARS